MKVPNLPDKKNCTGCMACADICMRNAIHITYEDGLMYPYLEKDICINCGVCTKHCPQINESNWNVREDVMVYGGWCKDDIIRKRSASGGAFSALALSVLKNGGYVVGASLMGRGEVCHRMISSVEDLHTLQNSKYVQSCTPEIYRKTKEKLLEGETVLFSGTPCQVGALNSYLGKQKQYGNLITIDVVCNGVPSRIAEDYFLAKTRARRILSFRDKDFGWVELDSQKIVYENNEGKRVSCKRKTDPFYKVFSTGLTQRDTCCDCKYSILPRFADITLADFWGIERFQSEWKDGISLIVANNEKGRNMIESCEELFVFQSSLDECVRANPRLVNGFKFHKYHPVMVWRKSSQKILGERIFDAVITNKYPYKLIWGLLKLLTIWSNRLVIRRELCYEKENRHNNNI